MAVLKCKMCGGDLNIVEGASTAECEYCGSIQTIPKVDDEKKLTLFGRANRLRAACEFDKAAGIYESIVADFPEEAEAYWGLVLCKYGIEYVDDPGTAKKVPTCHRSSFDSIMEDTDLEQALENADTAARRVYREEAKQIEEIRKGIIAVSASEDPYDIFICYKETDENGDRTLDSVLAQDLYEALTNKGYRVFFARITLEDKLGLEYEPYIFAALNSAKIMLAVGTDYEFYNAVWVKNEWSRYLKLMTKDKEKHLIPCYKGIDAYDMPKEFARLQAQDLGKVGATQDLLRGIEKLHPLQPQTPAPQPAYQAAAQDPTLMVAVNLLKRGDLALEAQDWAKAAGFYEEVLKYDAENADAYTGLAMCEAQVQTFEQLVAARRWQERNYVLAKRFSSPERQKQFTDLENDTTTLLAVQAYTKATGLMTGAICPKDYLDAKEIFLAIADYEDSAALAEQCEQLYTKQTLYATVKAMMLNRVNRLANLRTVVTHLTELGDYLDAPQLLEKCQAERNKEYDNILKLLPTTDSTWDLEVLISKLQHLRDVRDAEDVLAQCQDRLTQLKQSQSARTGQVRIWISNGKCAHCGGDFKGLLVKRCIRCGEEKNY